MTTYTQAAKKGWKTRRKNFTPEQIKKHAIKAGKKGGKRSADVRGYKQVHDAE